MQLVKEPYLQYQSRLPKTGRQIIGQYDEKWLVVYQAFNPLIAEYAVKHQQFGGPHYSFTRMSWIKPNFLWMMYRAGWAAKPNQERILALWVARETFERILSQAVHSTFRVEIYQTEANWQAALGSSEVRLQWDPDHNPYGHKLDRKAIQLGLRGHTLRQFATEGLGGIEDITEWVKREGQKVAARQLDELEVVREEIYPIENETLVQRLGLLKPAQ